MFYYWCWFVNKMCLKNFKYFQKNVEFFRINIKRILWNRIFRYITFCISYNLFYKHYYLYFILHPVIWFRGVLRVFFSYASDDILCITFLKRQNYINYNLYKVTRDSYNCDYCLYDYNDVLNCLQEKICDILIFSCKEGKFLLVLLWQIF